MSELAKTSREAMRAKAKRLTSGEPHAKVDSSTWTPPEMENAGVKTGARPISKRQYKSGGKVHGANAKKRGDRMARKSGGKVESEDRSKRYLTPDNLINRDVRMANEERKGIKHVGAFKKGGRIHKEGGGEADDAIAKALRQAEIEDNMKNRGIPARVPLPPRRPVVVVPQPRERIPLGASPTFKKGGAAKHDDVAEDKKLIKKMVKTSAMKRDEHCWGGEAKKKKADGGKIDWLRKKHASGGEVFSGDSLKKVPGVVPGGRNAHKRGGKAKGKTHININVNAHPAGMPMAGGPMGGAPMMPPRPPMAPPMAPPAGGPPMGGGQQIDPAMLAMLAKGGAGGPPQMPPQGMPMARKSGGRAMGKPEHIIDHAAGGGLGRLEKIKAYGHNA